MYEQLKRDKSPAQIAKAEQNPKHKMAMVFKWYFSHTTRLALEGKSESKIDYQIHCGTALGAFNQWVKGTPLENWRNRHVDLIGKQLMEETAFLRKGWYRLQAEYDQPLHFSAEDRPC